MKTPVPDRVMVIMAHPDDPEFFCGGTIALWCADGVEVTYLILTNGNKGSADPGMTAEKLAQIRKEEQQAAADLLGVEHVLYFGEPDGELRSKLDLRVRVVAEIRRHKPDIVVTLDPTRYFYYNNTRINHADHRAAGEVVIDAVFPAAGNRMYHPELLDMGLEPYPVNTVFLAGTDQPNHWVDISTAIQTKLEAILCHNSQLPEPEEVTARVRERHRAIDPYGREVYREEFKVLNIS